MLIPETMTSKINKIFYDKTVDIMNNITEMDAEGGIKYFGRNGDGLPTGYNKLDYINIDNSSVLIEHSATLNTSIEMEIELTAVNNVTMSLFCCRIASNNNELNIFLTDRGYICFAYSHSKWYGLYQLALNTRYVIKTDKNKLYLNDNLILTVNEDNLHINNITGSLLFANYAVYDNMMKAFANYARNIKCYGVKIWENDLLVTDYIPCVYNDVVGFYNLVTNSFVSQFNGDGNLTEGSRSERIVNNFKGNVSFSNCERIQKEYGLDYLIDIAITTNTNTQVNINDIIQYNDIIYNVKDILKFDSHILIVGVKWKQ